MCLRTVDNCLRNCLKVIISCQKNRLWSIGLLRLHLRQLKVYFHFITANFFPLGRRCDSVVTVDKKHWFVYIFWCQHEMAASHRSRALRIRARTLESVLTIIDFRFGCWVKIKLFMKLNDVLKLLLRNTTFQ